MFLFSEDESFVDGTGNRKTESSSAKIRGERIRHRFVMLLDEGIWNHSNSSGMCLKLWQFGLSLFFYSGFIFGYWCHRILHCASFASRRFRKRWKKYKMIKGMSTVILARVCQHIFEPIESRIFGRTFKVAIRKSWCHSEYTTTLVMIRYPLLPISKTARTRVPFPLQPPKKFCWNIRIHPPSSVVV